MIGDYFQMLFALAVAIVLGVAVMSLVDRNEHRRHSDCNTINQTNRGVSCLEADRSRASNSYTARSGRLP